MSDELKKPNDSVSVVKPANIPLVHDTSDDVMEDDRLLMRGEYAVLFEFTAVEPVKFDDQNLWFKHKGYLHDPHKKYPSDLEVWLKEEMEISIFGLSSQLYVGSGIDKKTGRDRTGKLLYSRVFTKMDEKSLDINKVGLTTRKNLKLSPDESTVARYPIIFEFAALEDESKSASGRTFYRYESYLHDPSARYPTGTPVTTTNQMPIGFAALSSQVYVSRSKKLEFRSIFDQISETALNISATGVAVRKAGV